VGGVHVRVGVSFGRTGEGPDDEVVDEVGVPTAQAVCFGDALARSRRIGRDVHERLDVGVAAGGVGDHHSAIGVPNEDHWPLDGREELAQVLGVGGRSAQRVGERDDRVAVADQATGDGVPAAGVGEGSMDQNDGGLRVARTAAGGRRHQG
jgi:hypothetical protein